MNKLESSGAVSLSPERVIISAAIEIMKRMKGMMTRNLLGLSIRRFMLCYIFLLCCPPIPMKNQDLQSHVSSVLTSDFKQRICNLPERAVLRCFHQTFKHIFVLNSSILQIIQQL